MLADLAIIPIGHSPHTSPILADVLKTIKESGLAYQLTPTSTCIEGTWDEIVAIAKRCHEIARTEAPHVVTTLRFEDDETGEHKLKSNLDSVEEKAGQIFDKMPAT